MVKSCYVRILETEMITVTMDKSIDPDNKDVKDVDGLITVVILVAQCNTHCL